VRIVREIDQQPPGDRDLRRQARALRADRVLGDLHQHRLPFREALLDRPRGVFGAGLAQVRDVQEAGALQADLDERRLHAGQHARHFAEIDVADQPAARGALDEQLLHHARHRDRDARLLRRDVDEDLFAQRRPAPLFSLSRRIPTSYSGRPITPE
jgi:hypothetical protein